MIIRFGACLTKMCRMRCGKIWGEIGPRACLFDGSMKARQKRHKCPKCGKYYVGYPALSRDDNKTEICPGYGAREAIVSFLVFGHSDHNSN